MGSDLAGLEYEHISCDEKSQTSSFHVAFKLSVSSVTVQYFE